MSQRRALYSLITAIAGLALGAVVPGGAAGKAARKHACGNERNATHVRASGLSCPQAANGIGTYEGAPLGCTNSRRCVESGENGIGGALLIVDCFRHRLSMSCTVYIRSRRGNADNPNIDGNRLKGRFIRGTVRFRMRHDPYGCPSNPVCHGRA